LQEVPDEVKGHVEAVAEATLRGHLKAQGTEEAGSQSYIPPDPKDDKALNLADDLFRGIAIDTAFPPNPNRTVPK
jgi:carboxyl-terminal processing protease